MRKALPLALAALLLPACSFVRHAVPTDPSGMGYPLHEVSGTFRDQVTRSGDLVTGLPRRLARHTRECWRNLTTDGSAR